MPRLPKEFEEAFREQCWALNSSCRAYDDGSLWEAKRLATAIMNLVHDSRTATSILTHLDLKASTLFFSTSKADEPGNMLNWHPLVRSRIETFKAATGDMAMRAGFVPNFVGPSTDQALLAFERWWNEPVYSEGAQILSRKVLVATLRDQDGGSHLDADISSALYKRLKGGSNTSIKSSIGGVLSETPILGAEAATCRQIAFELQVSFQFRGLMIDVRPV